MFFSIEEVYRGRDAGQGSHHNIAATDEANDRRDRNNIGESSELTLEKLEIPPPTTRSLKPAAYVISNSQNRFGSIMVEANDNQRLVAYSNRSYEIAGNVSVKTVVRGTL